MKRDTNALLLKYHGLHSRFIAARDRLREELDQSDMAPSLPGLYDTFRRLASEPGATATHACTVRELRSRRATQHGPRAGRKGRPRLIHQIDPHACMIAGVLGGADAPIDARRYEPRGNRRTQQQMIDAKPGIPVEGTEVVLPERVNTLVGMKLPDGIRPASSK